MRQVSSAAAIAAAAVLCLAAAKAQAQTHQMQYQAVRLQMADVYKSWGCLVNVVNAAGWSAGVCADGTHAVPSMWDPQGNQVVLAAPADASQSLIMVTGINSSGALSGYYISTSNATHAVRWNATGTPTVLTDSGFSTAAGIDDAGNVVGVDGVDHQKATVWHVDGSLLHLPAPAGAVATAASGLNAVGTIVGSAVIADAKGNRFTSPVVWKARQPQRLMPDQVNGTIAASAINDQGVVVGYGPIGDAAVASYEWKAGTTVQLPGLPGGKQATALGLNASFIVGYAQDSKNFQQAVKWVRGSIVQLQPVTILPPSLNHGVLSYASAVNANGWIAANYQASVAPLYRPVILQPIASTADAE